MKKSKARKAKTRHWHIICSSLKALQAIWTNLIIIQIYPKPVVRLYFNQNGNLQLVYDTGMGIPVVLRVRVPRVRVWYLDFSIPRILQPVPVKCKKTAGIKN
ncbi:hypothetical protein B0H13DRAFT_1862421 [Mycena leptocephala]|nr:hypothetical protein B0H13DRAFT_1862421 [Mycena leptocephala]